MLAVMLQHDAQYAKRVFEKEIRAEQHRLPPFFDVSADSEILDHAGRWLNLAKISVLEQISDAWIVDLG